MEKLFKSEKGKKEVLKLYEDKLLSLAIETTNLEIKTSFGITNIVVTGDKNNPPLLLIHGSNGCAPIALECYPNLSKKYLVYAVDVLSQPNKSEEVRLSIKDDSYGRWLNEVIDVLDINAVTLVGFSLGGLIILKTLAYNESKIKQSFLASPAYIVNGNPLIALLKIFIPMRRYMSSHNVKHIENFLSVLFTERDQFAIDYLSKVFIHFNMDFTPVPTISKADAKKINTPITIFAADKDIIFPGKKMIKRSQTLFPSLLKSKLILNSKHVQSSAQNTVVEQCILDNAK